MTEWRQALVALGSNLGDRLATLRDAVAQIRSWPEIRALECSRCYETEPVGVLDQPRFLNQVIGLETTLSPEGLLERLQRVEQEHGRARDVRWGPRTLDLDLLAFEDETRSVPALTLPHPRMWDRAFVVVPLRDVLARESYSGTAWAAFRAKAKQTLPEEPTVRAYAT